MIERLPGRERKEGEEEVERNLCPFGCVCVVKDNDTCLVGCSVGRLLGLGDGIITAYGVGIWSWQRSRGEKSPQETRLFIYLQGMKKNERERERERENTKKLKTAGNVFFLPFLYGGGWCLTYSCLSLFFFQRASDCEDGMAGACVYVCVCVLWCWLLAIPFLSLVSVPVHHMSSCRASK